MKIYRTNSIMDIYKSQSVAKTQKGNEMPKDQVTLSNEALEIQKAYQVAKSAPDTRTEKIEAIKAQIKSGTYNIDAKAISEKIISQLDIRG